MCTLTYCLSKTGYSVFFNRDEQRSRARALPPKFHASMSAIYPIDPEGNGTWLASHQSGYTLALLNLYQAPKKDQKNEAQAVKKISRGLLISTLLQSNQTIEEQLNEMNLRRFMPFQLVYFSHDLSLEHGIIKHFVFDGLELKQQTVEALITSSSVNASQVTQKRRAKYQRLIAHSNNPTQQHIEFHHSTDKEGAWSVRMSRDDALSVSFSHIAVERDNPSSNATINFIYYDWITTAPPFQIIHQQDGKIVENEIPA